MAIKTKEEVGKLLEEVKELKAALDDGSLARGLAKLSPAHQEELLTALQEASFEFSEAGAARRTAHELCAAVTAADYGAMGKPAKLALFKMAVLTRAPEAPWWPDWEQHLQMIDAKARA